MQNFYILNGNCKVSFSKDEIMWEGGDIYYVLKITFNFDTM